MRSLQPKLLVRSVGLRGWVRQQLSGSGAVFTSAQVDLVEPLVLSVPVPKRVGLDRWQHVQPWSISRLTSLLHQAADQPSESSFQAARFARHRLSSFWMSAPVDFLQHLYEGNMGALQQLLLESSLTRQGLAQDEQSWAKQLHDLLEDPEQQSRYLNVVLALLPYTQPGQLSLSKPQKLPPNLTQQ